MMRSATKIFKEFRRYWKNYVFQCYWRRSVFIVLLALSLRNAVIIASKGRNYEKII